MPDMADGVSSAQLLLHFASSARFVYTLLISYREAVAFAGQQKYSRVYFVLEFICLARGDPADRHKVYLELF